MPRRVICGPILADARALNPRSGDLFLVIMDRSSLSSLDMYFRDLDEAVRQATIVHDMPIPARPPPVDFVDGDGIYEVDSILARQWRASAGQWYYRILWLGYPFEEGTWEL